MILPLWFIFGLGSAALSAVMMLSQERLRVNGFALAVWNKATCVIIMIPFMAVYGFPHDPLFYVYLGATAALYAVSDVIFFNGITKTNAGAVARMLPVSVIFSFLLWFAVDAALLQKYLGSPFIFALIFGVLCLFAFFAARLKKCPLSMETFRAVWFVVFAATLGAPLAKAATMHAPEGQGPYAYVFCQALMMLACWVVYFLIRKPAPVSALVAPQVARAGLLIGCIGAGMTFLAALAYYYVDNPAYIPAVRFLDSVLILGAYKLWRRKSEGDIWSGLGLVACAAALVVLKAQVK